MDSDFVLLEKNFSPQKTIVVQKFGGTSLGSSERIKAVAKICKQTKERENCSLLIVVSAMGETTDQLENLLAQVVGEDKKNNLEEENLREKDLLLSSGEQVSTALLSLALQKENCRSRSLTGWQAGIQTTNKHTKARIKKIDLQTIENLFAKDQIVIVAGFQGICNQEITTLGRGGSDTSAVALAAALSAQRCDIFTDVDGIYTTDPRIVRDAKKLDFISYDEMLELSSIGAKVLHPRSVEIAKNHKLLLQVKNSWYPEKSGTLVYNSGSDFENYKQNSLKINKINLMKTKQVLEEKKAVRGVALDKKQARLSVVGVPDQPGIASKIFYELAKREISVDIIVQNVGYKGEAEVDFTVNQDQAYQAKFELDKIAKEISARDTFLDESVEKVSIVGAGMIDQPGIAAKMFEALGKNDINIQMISTSEIRISCIVNENQGAKSLQLIHDAFELGA